MLFFFFKLDWHNMVEREKFADAALICTPDRLHKVNIQYMFMLCIYVFLSVLSLLWTHLITCWTGLFIYWISTVCVPQEPAMAFAKKGYHVLLEKPMAVSELTSKYGC